MFGKVGETTSAESPFGPEAKVREEERKKKSADAWEELSRNQDSGQGLFSKASETSPPELGPGLLASSLEFMKLH